MRRFWIVLFCLCVLVSHQVIWAAGSTSSLSNRQQARASLIPYPQEVKWNSGALNISNTAIVIYSKNDAAQIADTAELLKSILIENGVKASISKGYPASLVSGPMTLAIDPSISSESDYEGYRLSVSSRNLKLSAPNAKGLFYGVQTIRQLIQHENGKILIPSCKIKDWPEFEIRGFMHDVGRNYQPPALLKEQIEVMAHYKYNVFHMHITDNPGWRLESKKYPQVNDPTSMTRKPGKIYSQEEFKDLVEFCRERHMILIPELDIPGHTEAFRKALNIKSMSEPRVQKILIDLFEELCELVPAEDMPYIHLGTDEARRASEKVNPNIFLPPIYKAIRAKDREIIGWIEGMVVKGDTKTINQLWARYKPHKGHACIDSRSNYVNHNDAFAGIVKLYYQKPGWGVTNNPILGGILCAWPDNHIEQERGVLKQNPVYSSMVTYSESVWTGKKKNYDQYWTRLPEPSTAEFEDFSEFENRLLDHRNRFFKDKEFFYVRQSHIPWRLIQFQPAVSTESTRTWLESMVKDIDRPDYRSPDFDDSQWLTLKKPLKWQQTPLKGYKGAVCYRKTIEIPAAWQGQDLIVELDKIDDFDLTYYNGEFIGASNNYNVQRIYTVPAALVKKGKAVITVTVVNPYGEGGLYADESQLKISQKNTPEYPVSLGGQWRCQKLGTVKFTKQKSVEMEVGSYPVEQEIKECYTAGSREITWQQGDFRGATIHLKHFFGFPSIFKEKTGTVYALTYIHSPKEQTTGFWIGFHDWSRSGGRRGGPLPQRGQWHINNAKVWVNDRAIAPPVWKNPGLVVDTAEIPWEDENYYYRKPTQISLQKGWNKVLLKIPAKNTWKWMFTCVPVQWDGQNVREVEGLTFSTTPDKEVK